MIAALQRNSRKRFLEEMSCLSEEDRERSRKMNTTWAKIDALKKEPQARKAFNERVFRDESAQG
jgi:flagellar biosynthesis/type III secretory pathway chaperone